MILKLKVDSGIADIANEFEKFRQEQIMCDVEIHSADGKIYKAHKVVLASRSTYFYHMLLSSFEEAKKSVVKWQEDESLTDEILRYIYTGIVHITGDNAQNLLRVGDQYQLPALFAAVEKHIVDNVDVDNCFHFLKVARQLDAIVLEDKAWTVIKNDLAKVSSFEEMDKSDIIKLSKEVIVPGDFVPKFLAWFVVKNDVDTAVEVIQNLDYTEMDKETIAKMNSAFANTMPCISAILQKMTSVWAGVRVNPTEKCDTTFANTTPCISEILQKMSNIWTGVRVNPTEKCDTMISAELTKVFCKDSVKFSSGKQVLKNSDHMTSDNTVGTFSIKRIDGNRVSVKRKGGDDCNCIVLFKKDSLVVYGFCARDMKCELAITGEGYSDGWYKFEVFHSAQFKCLTPIQIRSGRKCVRSTSTPSFRLYVVRSIVETFDKVFSFSWNLCANTVTIRQAKRSHTKTRYAIFFFMDASSMDLGNPGELRHLHECDSSENSDETISINIEHFKRCQVFVYELTPF